VAFGIIQRYVMWEVVRAFMMALLTMTIIFVLFMVMAEAANLGLSPREIATLVPFVIPSTLPFTVPVSMLFAVTVAYGRIASDKEIIAIKTAGLGVGTVLWPAYLMGIILSIALCALSYQAIPLATHGAKMAIYQNFEEMFYKVLKKDREFTNPSWPFLIRVSDVDLENKMMYNALFKQRKKGDPNPNAFAAVIQSKKATIRFDAPNNLVRVKLIDAEVSSGSAKDDIALLRDRDFEFDLPGNRLSAYDAKIQELTTPELVKKRRENLRKIQDERTRQAIEASFGFASGRIDKINWDKVDGALVDYDTWVRKANEYETEKQFRIAQSVGGFFFVFLGAPVGILFARRDFLSAFISCFMPIILVYYPLMLLGVNLGKEGVLDPLWSLWSGNVLLFILACFVLPPVRKH
jgi:lipopolysaccharide export system permease protein